MMCLVDKNEDGEIVGWIIGTDADDLRQRCEAVLCWNLTDPSMQRLKAATTWISTNAGGLDVGKHVIPESGHTLLIGVGEPVIDYRHLLVKYIAHVLENEGADFIADGPGPSDWINTEEWFELGDLAVDALNLYQKSNREGPK